MSLQQYCLSAVNVCFGSTLELSQVSNNSGPYQLCMVGQAEFGPNFGFIL